MAVKSADRVLDILELLASTGRSMTHSEIARRLNVPKSSLSQLLRNLTVRGYVEMAEESQAYRLGEGSFALARRGGQTRELVALARPHLEVLTAATGESSGLYLLNKNMAERVCSVNSKNALLYALHEGVRAPLYAHSGGKIFLAWLSGNDRENYLRQIRLVPLTDKTIVSVSVLRRQLQRIRSEGIAYSMSEFTPGVIGVGVPIFNIHGRILATLGLALPAARFDRTRLSAFAEKLHIGAQAISDDVKQHSILNFI